MKRQILVGLGMCAALVSGAAMARVNVDIGIGIPGVVVGPPAYYYREPAPVYYAPPPPVYYRPAPVYVAPPPPAYYYGPPPRYWRERHYHRRHWRDRYDD